MECMFVGVGELWCGMYGVRCQGHAVGGDMGDVSVEGVCVLCVCLCRSCD